MLAYRSIFYLLQFFGRIFGKLATLFGLILCFKCSFFSFSINALFPEEISLVKPDLIPQGIYSS